MQLWIIETFTSYRHYLIFKSLLMDKDFIIQFD